MAYDFDELPTTGYSIERSRATVRKRGALIPTGRRHTFSTSSVTIAKAELTFE